MVDFIKSKLFLSVLFLGLAAFIIGGATMAWFTDDADLQAAEFHAGTVKISAPEIYEDKKGKEKSYPIVKMPEMNFENVNPGDCATVTWEFVNEGTKAVQLKVKLNELWDDSDLDVDLDEDTVYYCPVDMKDGKGWVMVDDENGDIWLYYIDKSSGELGSVRGTFNPEDPDKPLEPEKVKLKIVLVFDAKGIDNDYQGARYILGGEDEYGEPSKVYAIQASNGAPESQWPEWEDVIVEDYLPEEDSNSWDNFEYFHFGNAGSLTKCWIIANHGEYENPEEPVGPIATFSDEHLVAASPGKKEGNPHADTKILGKITEAKYKNGKDFTGWANVTFRVRDQFDRDKYGEVTRSIYFENGVCQLAHVRPRIIVENIYTRNNDDVSITNVSVSD